MQMGHAIDAAIRIDAADSFAHSASKTDGGIHDAVGKLNLQATAIDDANGIARTSLEQTKKALRVSRERFNQDERPVVLISNITPSLPNGGQPYQVLFDKINFGKSPAIHFSSQAVLFVGADSLAQVYNWFLHVQGPEKGITGPKSTIPQGVFSNLSDRHSGTVSTLTPLNKDEAYQVMMGHYYALGGRMWYQDIAGNEYQTDFCLIGTTLADTAFCPIHNDIK